MSEEVKQEGEFKVKKPSKPKNLGKTEDVTKIEIPSGKGEVDQEVTKVEIKTEEDAVQEPSADASDDTIGQPEDSGDSEEVVEEVLGAWPAGRQGAHCPLRTPRSTAWSARLPHFR